MRMIILRLAGAVLAVAATAVQAADKPLWELGVGVAPVTFPAYRGADEQVSYTFPIPYIVYRGDRLRVDRGGARGMLWDSDNIEVDLSFDGAIPVDSSDDGPRAGMEELDPILEVGPSLKVGLAETDSGRLEFRLPVRAAIAIDDGVTRQEGWKIHPMLNYAGAGRWLGCRLQYRAQVRQPRFPRLLLRCRRGRRDAGPAGVPRIGRLQWPVDADQRESAFRAFLGRFLPAL